MKKNFDKCLQMLLVHEGGFTADKFDPGNDGDGYGNQGSTNMGVTAKTYAAYTGQPAPIEVMKALTFDDIAPIYKQNYWDRARCDDLASGLDWSVFDWQVNSGNRSRKALQKIVGAKPDGAIGPKTLQAIGNYEARELIEKMHSSRQVFYSSLKTFARYGKGWTRRNNETLEAALHMLE